jgi:hypothetical protein
MGGRRVSLTTSLPSESRYVQKMWELRRLTILYASTVCYRDNFAFYLNPFSYLVFNLLSTGTAFPLYSSETLHQTVRSAVDVAWSLQPIT